MTLQYTRISLYLFPLISDTPVDAVRSNYRRHVHHCAQRAGVPGRRPPALPLHVLSGQGENFFFFSKVNVVVEYRTFNPTNSEASWKAKTIKKQLLNNFPILFPFFISYYFPLFSPFLLEKLPLK